MAHGEFGKWCESISMNTSQASRFIKVYEELAESNLRSNAKLGFANLIEIATLPPEHREVPHELPSGETKKPEDMTVRELRELKRRLKAEQAERERLERENEDMTPDLRY